MTDIQRWYIGGTSHMPPGSFFKSDKGNWVTYADHVEALRQAEQRGHEEAAAKIMGLLSPWEYQYQRGYREGYEQGQRDARVEAAKVWEQMSYDTGYAAGKAAMRRYLMADDENTYAQGQREALARLKARCVENKHHDCVCDLGGNDD